MSNRLRRHTRHEFATKVWLTWDGGSNMKQVACKGLDISSSGMRVSSPEPIAERTFVNFRIQGTMFVGAGSIRSCAHSKMKYLIGVEFSQGVQWDPERFPLGKPAPQSAEPEKTDEATRAVEQ